MAFDKVGWVTAQMWAAIVNDFVFATALANWSWFRFISIHFQNL